MQITRQSEYAIKTILELSKNTKGNISAKTIAERQDIPEFFLKKTVQILARAGMVRTTRGAQGGVKLLLSPEETTIADIIQAIDGEIAINVCLAKGGECLNKETCQIRMILQRAQKAMIEELSKETIAELAGP